MTISKKHLIILLILTPIFLSAQKRDWRNFKLNLDRIVEVQDSFVMKRNNEKIGSWNWNVKVTEKSITFTDRSVLFEKVWEDAIFEVDKNSLEEFKIDLKMIIGENSVQNNNRIKEQHLTGLFTRTVKTHTTFFELDSNYANLQIVPRAIFLGLLPAIINAEGFTTDINFYSGPTHSILPVKLTVKPTKTVTVEAGTFETTPIEILKQEGQGVSNIFYLRKDYPYTPVRVDVIEQNMVLELSK